MRAGALRRRTIFVRVLNLTFILGFGCRRLRIYLLAYLLNACMWTVLLCSLLLWAPTLDGLRIPNSAIIHTITVIIVIFTTTCTRRYIHLQLSIHHSPCIALG